VWDVGANVGLFSFAAASKAGSEGKVLALEPDVWLASLLGRSAARQPPSSAPVTVLPIAAAASAGLRGFCMAGRARAANHLRGYGSPQARGVLHERLVPTLSLDDIAGDFPPPTLLKIDVEGAELEVLRGGIRVIEQAQPVIICEVFDESASAVGRLLSDRGYRLFDGALAKESRLEIGEACWTTLALTGRHLAATPPDVSAGGTTPQCRSQDRPHGQEGR
jgi:FkbM family methyltransferase